MARGGINKALVQQAREAVLAKCQRQLNLDPFEVRTKTWTPLETIHVFVRRSHASRAALH